MDLKTQPTRVKIATLTESSTKTYIVRCFLTLVRLIIGKCDLVTPAIQHVYLRVDVPGSDLLRPPHPASGESEPAVISRAGVLVLMPSETRGSCACH